MTGLAGNTDTAGLQVHVTLEVEKLRVAIDPCFDLVSKAYCDLRDGSDTAWQDGRYSLFCRRV
jgi:hypothetical protein